MDGDNDEVIFEQREYQVALIEKAKQENVIICLPTGSGKTYIALRVIQSMAHYVSKENVPFGERKWIIFTAVTVPLVQQQAKWLSLHCHLSVGQYTGDMQVDVWDETVWARELTKYQILVMTPDIVLQLIQHNFMSLSSVALLVIDECHHAVGDHPLRHLMIAYKSCQTDIPLSAPKVLGLTATLLNSKVSPQVIPNELKKMEEIMCCSAYTYDNVAVQQFATDPETEVRMFCPPAISEAESCVIDILKKHKDSFDDLKQFAVSEETVEYEGQNYTGSIKNPVKKYVAMLSELMEIVTELGLYCASCAALAYIVQIELRIMRKTCQKEIILYRLLETAFLKVRRYIDDYLSEFSPLEQMTKFASPKLLELLNVLKSCKPNDNSSNEDGSVKRSDSDERLCGIVFVERRIVAVVLHYYLKTLAEVDGEYNFLRSSYIVGNSGNPSHTRENEFFDRKRRETLELFHQRRLNLIFSTSVLEEGIDVPKCNLVLRFDGIKNFTSYIQSKGRARRKNARFVLLVERHKHDDLQQELLNFSIIHSELQSSLEKRPFGLNITEETQESNNEQDENCILPYKPFGEYPQVTAAASVSLLHRYCNTLPQESCIKLKPLFAYQKLKNGFFKGLIKLPGNAAVRHIEGIPMRSILSAKRAVCLEAIKCLHTMKELSDDHLLPVVSFQSEWIDEESEESGPKTGTKKKQRIYKKKFCEALQNAWPTVGEQMFLYHIHMVCENPELFEQCANSPEKASYSLGIVTSKKLPKICRFPLFPKLGKVWVTLVLLREQFTLSQEELSALEDFHRLTFEQLLGLNHSNLFFDPRYSSARGPLVVPILRPTPPRIMWEIDFSMSSRIQEFNTHFELKSENCKQVPSEEYIFDERCFSDAVIVPFYRGFTQQLYLAVEISYDMNPMTSFPDGKDYDTYYEYFTKKYNVSISNHSQPLVSAKACGVHSYVPLYYINARKSTEGSENRDERAAQRRFMSQAHLVPELCCVHPIPASLFIQIVCLPSALYRIEKLMMVEEFRQRIVKEVGIGKEDLPKGDDWITLDCNVGKEKRRLQGLHINEGKKDDIAPRSSESNETGSDCSLPNNDETNRENDMFGNTGELLIDPGDIFDVTLHDLKLFHQFITSVRPETRADSFFPSVPRLTPAELSELFDYDRRNLNNGIGVELSSLTQALTLSGASDGFDLERLETIGDSFLKYAVSVHLFCSYPSMGEGKLTMYRMSLISNNFLYKLAVSKNLQEIIVGHAFEPKKSWMPPGYAVPMHLEEVLVENKAGLQLIDGLEITELSDLSAQNMETLVTALIEDARINNNGVHSDLGFSSSNFFKHHRLSDKSVADCVESLIGAFLLACGQDSALDLMNWLGICDRTKDHRKLTDHSLPYLSSCAFDQATQEKMQFVLSSRTKFEHIIGYTFREPLYFLQAFSHPTFYENSVTDCYQRLEYLGDAVLDFLITHHIFCDSQNHSPGELTDLRSALVNNITFGSWAVKYQFHKFLNHTSPQLQDMIEKFTQFQTQHGHDVTGHFELLCDDDTQVASEVEVPKVLGDIFESVAGAIFLDSGMSLQAVWRVYYPLMKQEIEKFSRSVPLSPIREIYELFPTRVQFIVVSNEHIQNCGKVMVQLAIRNDGSYFGVGTNKRNAKLAAAKCALRKAKGRRSLVCI